jgi:hypothetical protein
VSGAVGCACARSLARAITLTPTPSPPSRVGARALSGCILSYALDKFNMVRQMPALPQNNGHLIVTTILGRVMPIALALHVPIALVAYISRSQQLLTSQGVPPDAQCSVNGIHFESSGVAEWMRALVSWLSAEEIHVLTACNHAVLGMSCGGIVVFALLGCGLAVGPSEHETTALSLGSYARVEAASSEALFSAQDGLRLYISPTQQQILMDLASKRGEDPLSERSAFTGDSVALSFEAFV